MNTFCLPISNAQSQHDALESVVAAERAAADSRVRDLAREYARRKPATATAPAASCEATESRARMLADLLGELDEMAQSLPQRLTE